MKMMNRIFERWECLFVCVLGLMTDEVKLTVLGFGIRQKWERAPHRDKSAGGINVDLLHTLRLGSFGHCQTALSSVLRLLVIMPKQNGMIGKISPPLPAQMFSGTVGG